MKKLQALEVLAKMNLTCQDVEQMVDQTRGERSKTPPKKRVCVEDSARLELELAKTAKRESKREATQPRTLHREPEDDQYGVKPMSKKSRNVELNYQDHHHKKEQRRPKHTNEEHFYDEHIIQQRLDSDAKQKHKSRQTRSPLTKSRRREYAISSDESEEYDQTDRQEPAVREDSREKRNKAPKRGAEGQRRKHQHESSYFEEPDHQAPPYDRYSGEQKEERPHRAPSNYNQNLASVENPYLGMMYPPMGQYGQVYNPHQQNFQMRNPSYYPGTSDGAAGYQYGGIPVHPGMMRAHIPGFSDRGHYDLNPHLTAVVNPPMYPQHVQSHNILAPGLHFDNPNTPKGSASMYLKPLGDIGQSAKKDFTRLDKIFSDTTQRIENLMNKPSSKRAAPVTTSGSAATKENRDYEGSVQMSPQMPKDNIRPKTSPTQAPVQTHTGGISFRGSPHASEVKIARNKREHPVDWQQAASVSDSKHTGDSSTDKWNTRESPVKPPTPQRGKALAWELSNDSPQQGRVDRTPKTKAEQVPLVVDVDAGVSLAEAFRRRQNKTGSNFGDRSCSQERSASKERSVGGKTFDKRELLERRKRGVVPRPPKSIGIVIGAEDYESKEAPNRTASSNRLNQKENSHSGLNATPRGNRSSVFGESNMNVPKSPKLPPPELLDRLAKGERPQVSKQEMKELTQKNYQNLPEIVLRKQEQQKKEEARKRIEKAKEYNRNMRLTRAATPHT